MEFFRAGEALIRSTQPLCLQFLAPTTYRGPSGIGAISRRHRPQQWQCQSNHRTFSSSRHQHQQANAAASINELAESLRREPRQERRGESALLDRALDLDKGVPTAPTGRTSRYASNNAQRGNNPLNESRTSRPELSSVDELVQGMLSSTPKRTPPPQPPASNTNLTDDPVQELLNNMSRGTTASRPSDVTIDIEGILGAAGNYQIGPAPEAKAPISTNDPAPIKLNSTTGRVIHVNSERGIDAARAFRMLGMRLAQNSVRRDAQRQRFHERPGLKRKRLKSERWRKRFKQAFQSTVARVVNMKRQGW